MTAPVRPTLSITFAIDGVSSETRVTRLRGREALSELFGFELDLVSDNPDIDLGAVGAGALLTIDEADAGRRYAHGIVGRLELVEHGPTATWYRATLVPRATRLCHRSDCRIFQGMSVVDIVAQVLSDHAVDHRMALASTYPVREYCVQYRESDWDFVSRLLEEEGILHFFEHTDASHVLVLADNASVHEPIAGDSLLPYRRVEGVLTTRSAVNQLRLSEELMTGSFSHTDYHFVKPELSLLASESADRDIDLEVYDYPGVYVDPKEGSRLAAVRLQERQGRRTEARGTADCPRFTPGYRFELFDHPHDTGNGLYVLLEVTHRAEPITPDGDGSGPARYEVEFRAIPDSVVFRPTRRTPRPTIKGVQTAIVTGPAGEEVHTDEHGRVKVQFHWDRKGQYDDKSSCWIRVSQLWAGAGYGGMWIPRVGHEVVVDFLEGDPDRPLVIGRVYHGANVPAHPLPAEKTKSTLRTSSSPGGEGANELTFEDKKGGELIYMHGERDLEIRVSNDKSQDIGNDESLHVGGNRRKTVDGDQTETVGLGKAIAVGAGHTETIGGSEFVGVGASATKTIGGDHARQVGGRSVVKVGAEEIHTIGNDLDLSVGGKRTVTVGGESVERVGANKSVEVEASLKVAATKDITVQADGDETIAIKGSSATTVGKSITITCGNARVTIEKSGKITVEGKDITLKADGKVKIDAKKDIVFKGQKGTLEASSSVKVKGSTVNIN